MECLRNGGQVERFVISSTKSLKDISKESPFTLTLHQSEYPEFFRCARNSSICIRLISLISWPPKKGINSLFAIPSLLKSQSGEQFDNSIQISTAFSNLKDLSGFQTVELSFTSREIKEITLASYLHDGKVCFGKTGSSYELKKEMIPMWCKPCAAIFFGF